MIGSKENCFCVNYANYFSRLIKPLNRYCSFNFYYNFVKRNNSRKNRTPLFTVQARCALNECPAKITIQRQVNESGEPNNYLTILFQGDVCHLVGDIQPRLITHDEKEKIQSEFIADSKLKSSTLYRKKNC